MLNHDAVVGTLATLERQWDRFFIRPASDAKQFAGEVMTWEQLETFRDGVRAVEHDDGVTLTLDDTVVMARCRVIEAEYRFFVFDGEPVTGSRYKLGDQVRSSTEVPEEVALFARRQAALWVPNRACAMDIAQTSEGLRIIELNSANSAGFYACDLDKIVNAVERLKS